MKKLLALLTAALFALPTLAVEVDAYQLDSNGDRIDPVVAGSTQSVEVVTEPEVAQIPFVLAVKMGKVAGHSTIDKFGINPEITTSTDPEDVWEFGGTYNYDANNTAPIMYLSSSDDSDTNDVILSGLDVDGVESTQTVTLDGHTPVSFDPLWRLYRMTNDGADPLAGIVYGSTDATPTDGVPADANVRAIIDDGKNQTLMALYTIPLGKVGFLYRGEVGVELEGNAGALAEYAHMHYESRRYGKAFTVKKSVTVFPASPYQDPRSFPDPIPALTDIKIVADVVSATMGLWATLDVLLVDEDLFTAGYLTAIGQPESTY